MTKSNDDHVDTILNALGPTAWYNLIQILLLGLATIPCALQLLSNIFIGQQVPHRCARLDNDSLALLLSPFEKTPDVSINYAECEIQIFSLNRTLHTERCLNGIEYDLPIDISFISQFGLVCEYSSLAKLSQTLVIAGQAIGALLGSFCADRYGRKPVLTVSGLVMLVSGLAIAYSTNFAMFAAFKFIIGACQQATVTPIVTLINEIMTTPTRRIGFVLCGFLWGVAVILLDVIALCLKDYSWRTLQMTLSLLSLGVILQIFFLKESIRWLMANGKRKEAVALVKYIARINGKNLEAILQECDILSPPYVQREIAYKQEEKLSNSDSEVTPNHERLPFLQMLKIPQFLFQIIIIWFAWFTSSLGFFAIYLTSTELAGDKYLNFFLIALMEQPATIFFYFFLNRWGRRKIYLFFHLLFGSSLIMNGILLSLEASPVTSAFSLIFYMTSMVGASGAFGFLFCYTPELYPTNIRSVGVGISSTIARFGGMLAPFTALLSEKVTWGPGVLIGSLALFLALMTKFLPETSNRELPQSVAELRDWYKEQKNTKKSMSSESRVM